MKLRNKRTGDIWEFDGGFSMKASRETTERAGGRGCSLTCYAHSIAELNEEWDDYKPAEPLIKDEKIRKVVRAWAELHGVKSVRYATYTYYTKLASLKADGESNGVYMDIVALPELKSGKYYTIAELCGEEEE